LSYEGNTYFCFLSCILQILFSIFFSIGKTTILIKTTKKAVKIANQYNPNPTVAPIAAVTHIMAAVVKFLTTPSWVLKIIIPAPKNPIPTIIQPKILEESKLETPKYLSKLKREMIIKRAEPKLIIENVLVPASFLAHSLSNPIKAPRAVASNKLLKLKSKTLDEISIK